MKLEIPITKDLSHKTITVYAKACTSCGRTSKEVKRTFFVGCKDFAEIKTIPQNNGIIYFNYDKDAEVAEVTPEIKINEQAQCIDYYYTVSVTDFINNVDLTCNKTNSVIDVLETLKAANVRDKVYIVIRPYCRETQQWKGQEKQFIFNVQETILFSPYIFNTDNTGFSGLAAVGTTIKLCVPVTYGGKIKYTLNGDNPIYAAEQGSENGDYIETTIVFDTAGEYELRAVHSLNGKHSAESRKTIKVIKVIAADETHAMSIDGVNILATT